MKQLLPSYYCHKLKEPLEPSLVTDTAMVAAIKNGRSVQILQCLKKHMLKPDPRVLQSLMEKLMQERQHNK